MSAYPTRHLNSCEELIVSDAMTECQGRWNMNYMSERSTDDMVHMQINKTPHAVFDKVLARFQFIKRGHCRLVFRLHSSDGFLDYCDIREYTVV